MSVNGSIIGPDNPTGVYQASGVWSLSEASEAVGAGQWPGVTDPHFSSVSLLMNFDSDFSNAGGYSDRFLLSTVQRLVLHRQSLALSL